MAAIPSLRRVNLEIREPRLEESASGLRPLGQKAQALTRRFCYFGPVENL
jgi:hypothetical protein